MPSLEPFSCWLLVIDASFPLPKISAEETDGFLFKFGAPPERILYQSSSTRVGVCHTAHNRTTIVPAGGGYGGDNETLGKLSTRVAL